MAFFGLFWGFGGGVVGGTPRIGTGPIEAKPVPSLGPKKPRLQSYMYMLYIYEHKNRQSK